MFFIISKIEENFKTALNIGWKGILAIFLAMTIIYIVILILNKVTKNKEE